MGVLGWIGCAAATYVAGFLTTAFACGVVMELEEPTVSLADATNDGVDPELENVKICLFAAAIWPVTWTACLPLAGAWAARRWRAGIPRREALRVKVKAAKALVREQRGKHRLFERRSKRRLDL